MTAKVFAFPLSVAAYTRVGSTTFVVKKKRAGRERDSQRQRVYNSDTALIAVAAKLPEVRDIERFVKRVFASERVKAAYPQAMRYDLPKVKDGRGRRRACGGMWSISIPLWARDEAVVLHELAHTVTQRVYGREPAAHGWQFCSIYLKLTLYIMGREAHDVLKAAFKQNRVRFTEPRAKRQISDEQRAALVERLAAARLKKNEAAHSRP